MNVRHSTGGNRFHYPQATYFFILLLECIHLHYLPSTKTTVILLQKSGELNLLVSEFIFGALNFHVG